MAVRILAKEGAPAVCSEAASLIESIDAEHLIADKGYDSDAVIRRARDQGMQARILPRKNRQKPRDFDKHIYRQRHQVENAFLHIKVWRGIATRHANNLASPFTSNVATGPAPTMPWKRTITPTLSLA